MAGKIQQYLRSEYIQPPPGPPTLDAKNSPLALLAQTCSAIGKELPNNNNKVALQTKLYASSEMKKSPNNTSVHKTSLALSRTSPVMTTSPKQSHSPSLTDSRLPSSHGSLKREKSPTNHCSSPAKKSRASPDASKSRDTIKSHGDDVKPMSHSLSEHKRSIGFDGKRRHGTSHDDADAKNHKTETSSRHKSPSSSSPHNARAFGGSCGCPSTSSAMEGSRHVTHSASTSPQQQMMSLYDPYCMGCQGPHVAGNPCFEGLKSPHLPFYPFTNPASTYPFYAQMLMAATARSGGAAIDPTPHVCNWVNVGSGSCGKRFSTADELLNHLRTHAVATTNTSNANYLMNGLEKMSTNPYAAYLSQQAAALAAVSPPAANPIASNFLSRSHSPLSRYHPYKSPNMLSQLSGVPSLPIAAGVGPYCSPYALYGQRLGAAASAFSYP